MTTVLALRALGLGDLLTVVPALRGLRRTCDRLVLAGPASLRPLAELIDAVDACMDTPTFVTAPPTGILTPAEPVDVAVNLHGRGPQSTAYLQTAGAPTLLAYGRTAEWRAEEHEVLRWCRLLAEAGVPADPADLAVARPPSASPAPGAVVVHPGAAHGSRRWPAARWATVAGALRSEGADVVITGTPAEVPLAAEVAAASGARNLAGRTDLIELAALVADSSLVASGDTGVGHLASAYAVRSVLLFGPTSPARWGPPHCAPHTVLWKGETGNPTAETVFDGLLAISTDEVIDACRAALAAS